MLDFPSPPPPLIIGTTYPDPPIPGVPLWRWDGEKWTVTPSTGGGGGGGGTLVVAPPTPTVSPNTLWWDNTTGQLHLWNGTVWQQAGIDDGVY